MAQPSAHLSSSWLTLLLIHPFPLPSTQETMRVLSFFLLAAPAVAFLAPVPSKPSSMALQASQRNNEVRRGRRRDVP